MAELSKTAAAAEKAVKKSQKKKEAPTTWPEILKGIQGNLNAGLSVPSDQVQKLLESYLVVREELAAFHKAARAAEDAPPVYASGEEIAAHFDH